MSAGVCRGCNGTGVRVTQLEDPEKATQVHMLGGGEPFVYSAGYPPQPVRFALCECIRDQLATFKRAFERAKVGL